MSRDQIFERIRDNMVELFEVDPAKVSLSTTLIEELGLDSIDAIDLAARLEDMTGKRLTESSIRKLRTVSDVVDTIHALLTEEPKPETEPSAEKSSA